jgi:uncharacterized repeat protein (TIGR01451 family)
VRYDSGTYRTVHLAMDFHGISDIKDRYRLTQRALEWIAPNDDIDLGVTKTVNDATVNEGDTVVFTVTVTNKGMDNAKGVALSDPVPAGLTYVGYGASAGTYNNVSGVWTVGTVTAHATVRLWVTNTVGTAAEGKTITNVATVANVSPADVTAGNNTGLVTCTVGVAAPGNVTGLGAAAGNRKVVVSWTNPGDADLAGIRVQASTNGYPAGVGDGVTVYDGLGTSVAHTNVRNWQTNYYKVFAYDEGPRYSSGVTCWAMPSNGPTWWQRRGVVDIARQENDYAAANMGQLKWIAKQAYLEMEAELTGGAGSEVTAMVSGFKETNNYCLVNLGQAKNTARPFYNRLGEKAGVTNYPWTGASKTNDYGAVNVGQTKKLWSFGIGE